MKLSREFYIRDNVTEVARDLLGKVLYTKINGLVTVGKIVETEAYKGDTDRACHAYPNRITKRNSIMFGEGGHSYVYMIYGIHYLFNIVTNRKGKADAVLVRALEPLQGLELMRSRRNKTVMNRITSGPGALSKAMGIDLELYGEPLTGDRIWLTDENGLSESTEIVATHRIGIDYAGEDAYLNWRYYLKNNEWVSKK